LQELQEEELQSPQECPPSGAVKPVSSLAMHEKREIARAERQAHLGQPAFSSDWLMGRIISNLDLQAGQKYS
jgi:hypothetical protein